MLVDICPPKMRPHWAAVAFENDQRIIRQLTVRGWYTSTVLAKVVPQDGDGCSDWLGHKDAKGYGTVHLSQPIGGNRPVRAHRVRHIAEVGPVGYGFVVDHRCNNTSCNHPPHLAAETGAGNMRRGVSPSASHGRRVYCAAGHRLGGGNITPLGLRRGTRDCHDCQKAWGLLQAAVVRAAAWFIGASLTTYKAAHGQSYPAAERVLGGEDKVPAAVSQFSDPLTLAVVSVGSGLYASVARAALICWWSAHRHRNPANPDDIITISDDELDYWLQVNREMVVILPT